jgi:hypothetical protein
VLVAVSASVCACWFLQLALNDEARGKDADGLGLETCIEMDVAIITRLGVMCVVEDTY